MIANSGITPSSKGQPPVHQGGDDDHPGQHAESGSSVSAMAMTVEADRVRADPVQQLTGGVPGGARGDAEQMGDRRAEPDGHAPRRPGQERDQVAGDRAQRQQQQARCRGGQSQDGRG